MLVSGSVGDVGHQVVTGSPQTDMDTQKGKGALSSVRNRLGWVFMLLWELVE